MCLRVLGRPTHTAPPPFPTLSHCELLRLRMYQESGLKGGHVIMLGPGNLEAALSALRAFPGGLQVGGGVTPASAGQLLEAGASHVIVTSYVFRDGRVDMERLAEVEAAVGKDRLVLDLSCRCVAV